MLASLTVNDVVLIQSANLEFARGLNVLTGETGAGKTILLDALGLAAGGRGQGRASVRAGATQASATAIFEAPMDHAAQDILAQQAIPAAEEIVLRRTLGADGRTRAFVNDEAVGVGLLRDVGAALLEVHGQSDDRGLFDSSTHRLLLDAFAGHESLVRDVASRFVLFDRARQELARLRAETAAAQADAEYVMACCKELAHLDARQGEEQELSSARALLASAARIGEVIGSVTELLGGEQGAETKLADSLKRLSRLGDEARAAISNAESALEQAFGQIEEGRQSLEAFLSSLDADPRELERKEDRLHALRAVARKFAVTVNELPRIRAEFETKLSALDTSSERVNQAATTVETARVGYRQAADLLSKSRKDAAKKLEKMVAAELVPLKLGHAQFRVSLSALADDSVSSSGLEAVAFEVSTVAGAPFGALAKIASGGELARFSLALKVVLAASSQPAAIVFDEVDRGVGGAVADAVGERLQRLSQTTQVLLVTHSPQVAARAERHFRISRKGDRMSVEILDEEGHVEEIARMLSGAAVTHEARAAAKKLVSEANAVRKPVRKRA
jgi:DNA repair protein RecN (Recombination protein N)